MADNRERETIQLFDLMFKLILKDASSTALVHFVNGLFEKGCPPDSAVTFNVTGSAEMRTARIRNAPYPKQVPFRHRFFENSGFYPDFILWLIDSAASVQHIVFIEPHGMGHERFRSDKMTLHKRIKEFETKLSGTVQGVTITLDSFIVSPTSYKSLGDNVNTKGDYLEMGVYFTEDDDYIGAIIRRVIA